jgi:hypothetical protein
MRGGDEEVSEGDELLGGGEGGRGGGGEGRGWGGGKGDLGVDGGKVVTLSDIQADDGGGSSGCKEKI